MSPKHYVSWEYILIWFRTFLLLTIVKENKMFCPMEYLCFLVMPCPSILIGRVTLCSSLLLLQCFLREDWGIIAHLFDSDRLIKCWVSSLCLLLLVITSRVCFFRCIISQLITVNLLAFKVAQLTTPDVHLMNVVKKPCFWINYSTS